MDLRKLEIFACVAQLQSFSKAAQQLHMAQPAVSIAVRKLEEELNHQLLERHKRSIRLTSQGEIALKKALEILQQVGELKDSMNELDNLLRGELSIACPSMLATYYFPQLLGNFLGQHPGLTASIIQSGTPKIETMLLQDEVELGVITVQGKHEGLEVIPLIKQQVVVCVGEQHPLKDRKRINIKQLNHASMVLYQADYFIRQKLDNLCKQEDVTLDIRMQSNFLPLLTNMVKNNLGATVGLEMMANQEAGIFGIQLQPKMEIQMAVARRKGRTISPANQAFLDWLTSGV